MSDKSSSSEESDISQSLTNTNGLIISRVSSSEELHSSGMHIAMKHSAKKRKREGTLNAQTKRRYSAKKVERDALKCAKDLLS
jgi:hypothetical protein